MNRKVGLFLLVFFCYLLWLYLAIYESSMDDWWTVKEIKHRTDDTVEIGVSNVKFVVGTVFFTLGGTVLYLLIRKRN
ncbi:hypothetical protein FZC74_11980 [Sutcliffiella horikoshii]|uniref:Uncharacterized protein n=1 Tax=Sutcliffiella horikoshii TaxID=79883 RepID=A0AA94WPN7_9BACI|nr:hypothetical protein [Sutcliffiella horikoshii]TYS58519.1 hypothetical protein FZC74_11980 [Sutcliffiella horikoshii]